MNKKHTYSSSSFSPVFLYYFAVGALSCSLTPIPANRLQQNRRQGTQVVPSGVRWCLLDLGAHGHNLGIKLNRFSHFREVCVNVICHRHCLACDATYGVFANIVRCQGLN